MRTLVDQHEQRVDGKGSGQVGHQQNDPPRLSLRPDGEDRLKRNERRDQEGAPRVSPELPPDLGVLCQDLPRPIGVRLTGGRSGKVDPCGGHRDALNPAMLTPSAAGDRLMLVRRDVIIRSPLRSRRSRARPPPCRRGGASDGTVVDVTEAVEFRRKAWTQ